MRPLCAPWPLGHPLQRSSLASPPWPPGWGAGKRPWGGWGHWLSGCAFCRRAQREFKVSMVTVYLFPW